MKKVLFDSYFLSVFIALPALLGIYQGKWTAPKAADSIINPNKGIASSELNGQKKYMQLCAVCHGNKGKGDGIGGMSLKPIPANLVSSFVQSNTGSS